MTDTMTDEREPSGAEVQGREAGYLARLLGAGGDPVTALPEGYSLIVLHGREPLTRIGIGKMPLDDEAAANLAGQVRIVVLGHEVAGKLAEASDEQIADLHSRAGADAPLTEADLREARDLTRDLRAAAARGDGEGALPAEPASTGAYPGKRASAYL